MSNNTVINYETYAEITNGLFFVYEIIFGVGTDDLEEFTFRQGGVQIIPRKTTGIFSQLQQYQPVLEYNRTLTRQDIEEAITDVMLRPRVQDYRVYVDPTTSQELLRFEEELNTLRERNRIENERTWADIRNMSEEELINHFDRISQEE